MTNVTLSIDDSVYTKMKRHSEIKWSEFIRKCIQQRIIEMEKIKGIMENESVMNMLASQEVLKKEWDNELDERWNNV
jgi:predicted CopG family antitoxin